MRLTGDNLSAVRGGRTLFADLGFSVDGGAALVLTGPNGAGKTTLLRIIAGLMPPAAGRIALEGGALEAPVGEQCHYVGHLAAVKPSLSIEENARFWSGFLGGARDRVGAALDTFGLETLRDIPAGYLSAGQKRRLGLARLLLAERPLWLLDEPTTSLDSAARDVLTAVVDRHLAAGGLAVAATHTPWGSPMRASCASGPGSRPHDRVMKPFWQLVWRDLVLAWKEGGTLGVALGFYVVVVTMLPLSLGSDLNLLSRIAPGVLWVALLLAALLSLGRLFETDYEDGSLEVLATGPLPLAAVAAAKSLAHWLSTGLPLTALAPLLGLLLNLPLEAHGMMLATMLAGTPAVSFLGSVGAALTMRARRGGLLLALLMLPLFVPTLSFGITAVSAALMGLETALPSFLILVAISLASVVLAPLAAAAALRAQLQ